VQSTRTPKQAGQAEKSPASISGVINLSLDDAASSAFALDPPPSSSSSPPLTGTTLLANQSSRDDDAGHESTNQESVLSAGHFPPSPGAYETALDGLLSLGNVETTLAPVIVAHPQHALDLTRLNLDSLDVPDTFLSCSHDVQTPTVKLFRYYVYSIAPWVSPLLRYIHCRLSAGLD
jgi:hypothetical protein